MIVTSELVEPNGVPNGLLERFRDKPREFEVVKTDVEGGVWLDNYSKDGHVGTYGVNVTDDVKVREELKRLGYDVNDPGQKITGVFDSYKIGSDGVVRATRFVHRHSEAYQRDPSLQPISPIDITPRGLTLGYITEQSKSFPDERGTVDVRTLHLITAKPKLPTQAMI